MNEKHFGVRMPLADYEALAVFADRDRSTVAQQVRQAVAEYVKNKQPDSVCDTCENSGRMYGFSQETYCEHCKHQNLRRLDLYAPNSQVQPRREAASAATRC